MALIDRVKRNEGYRRYPYRDSREVLTIGYGFNIDETAKGPGLDEDECEAVLEIRLDKVRARLFARMPWVSSLDHVRQDVLVEMAYNLGVDGLLGFNRTLTMIQAGNYEGAAAAMLESKWATQVGERAKQLSGIMRTGIDA